MKLHKVTKRHDKMFVKKFKEVADFLGVSASWDIEFKFERIITGDYPDDTSADIYCDCQARRAVVTNNIIRNEKPTDASILLEASHEVCHILTAPLIELAMERYVSSEKSIDTEEHALIQTILKLIV